MKAVRLEMGREICGEGQNNIHVFTDPTDTSRIKNDLPHPSPI